MVKFFTDIFKNKEIRNRIIYTIAILLVYKLGQAITIPRIDLVKLSALEDNSILNLLNMLGGGNIESFSIFALGVGPYITSSIIIQLLSMDVIPQLTELSKSGEKGRHQIEKITKYLAVVLAFVQSVVMTYTFSVQYGIVNDPGPATFMYVGVIMTAGTLFSCWLGDRISMNGIGNGISILIFTGIVGRLPSMFTQVYTYLMGTGSLGIVWFIGYVVLFLIIMILVIYMTQAERRIPIQYTSSGVSRGKNDMTFIPLKINSAGVTPVIFANAVMAAPLAIVSFFKTNSITKFLSTIFDSTTTAGLIIYLVLVGLFTFFYTNLQVDSEKMSENLGKNGSYILGVKPGKDTNRYIYDVLNRITVLGAIFLIVISVIPFIMTIAFPSFPKAATLGGTSIIIAVGVALETAKDIKGKLAQKSYHGFINK